MRARDIFSPAAIQERQELDELQGVKSTPRKFDSIDDFRAFMQNEGFHFLGDGLSGAVFTHKAFHGRYVLKVFHDAHYADFVKLAQANSANPSFPKFFGRVIPVTTSATGTVMMVRIEVLKEMRGDQFEALFGGSFGFIDIKNAARKLAQRTISRKDVLASEWDERGLGTLLDALVIIYGAQPDGSRDDLHSENVMMRGNVPVITDPWQGAKGYPFKW